MQGQHHYQPELFSQIDYEQLIPPTHLLRKIDKVLDLSFLKDLTAPLYVNEKGRPSIAPDIFVRMILLQSLYNIDSDRQLCEEVGYNLAYRWFCKLSLTDSVPEHSSLTRIRDRFGEKIYKEIFKHVVDQCIQAGLVKGKQILVDGSMISANASIYSMVEREEKLDTNDSKGIKLDPSKDGLSNNDLRRNSIVGTKISNQTHISKTDPDATLSGKANEYKSLRHKTHEIIDGHSRVILDCHVTTGAVSEHSVFPERFEAMQNEFNLKVEEVIADRGYGAGATLEFLEEKGVASNIPLWSTRVGSSFEKEEGFEFDRKTNSMTCPQGHEMNSLKMDNDAFMFVVSKLICDKCPLNATCISDAQRRNRRGKRVRIDRRQHLYQAVLAQEKDPQFKVKLRERMWKIEGIFAEAKSHHGLRRARYRGRTKVQIQVYVVAIVQNLKRLANSLFGDPAWPLDKLIFSIKIRLYYLKIRLA